MFPALGLLVFLAAAPAPEPAELLAAFRFMPGSAVVEVADPVPTPSIVDLVGKIKDLRAKQADLAKQEATTTDSLKAALASQQAMLDELKIFGPKPPPTPPAPAPAPSDPLVETMKAAFAADAGDLMTKKGDALQLAELYAEAAKLADDKTILTPKDLNARVSAAGDALAADRLTKCREAIRAELKKTQADMAKPFTDDSRKAVASIYRRGEAAFREVAK